jgi:hypothetical protein
MLDLGNFAIHNVRIDRYLRRRRNGNGDRGAGHGGIVRNVDVVGNVGNLGSAGNLGIVGNVRCGLEQHCFIVGANVDVAHNGRWRCPNGNSVGIHRDRKSWSEFRRSGANDQRIAHRFIRDDGHFSVPNERAERDAEHYGQLLNNFNREPKS